MNKAGAVAVSDKQTGISNVKNGSVDSYMYYPNDVTKNTIEVYAKDTGVFSNSKYSSVATNLLRESVKTDINNAKLVNLISTEPAANVIAFKDGQQTAGMLGVIAPLLFVVIFYIVIVMLGNNLLNSTVEEKENRVTEMILTTVNPSSLIIGKLIATFMAGFVQIAVFLVLAAIGVGLAFIMGANTLDGFGQAASAGASMINPSQLAIDPLAMIIGLFILIGGLMVFTGSLVAIGAIMPTAKEAGQYFGVIIMLLFIPFYIAGTIVSDPNSFIVQIFTYFPFTAPITALIRNALGSLSLVQALIVITELIIFGAIIIRLAVQLFRYGAMQYSGKLSLKTIFKQS